MAFGIKRVELQAWKKAVSEGEMAFLTHYWLEYGWKSGARSLLRTWAIHTRNSKQMASCRQ